ncbi:hypothetical protein [Chamaesiphon polymorphus]|uniref:DUF3990 domain-containing protein n=1 Tax=Chamaesiphon polymorphus CCALA 037 TaxID=2107692 RepID=A0A2T1GL82_9CYAN|nr:hypothetical protein [Chamaesiphon polymorphus]PSB58528.1 hypothetical protein C7B77_04470 [Chamaesiphon polymorphus CCALA 037]
MSDSILNPIKLVGYHGTNLESAQQILQTGFILSRNKYDWLGKGVYFWQDAPYRAWDWASEYCGKHGGDPAVIRSVVKINRGEFMDLLDYSQDPNWANHLSMAHQYLQQQTNSRLPPNKRAIGYHALDRLVLDTLIEDILKPIDINVIAVRACFQEGEEIYPGSAIYNKSHIQVAVRDTSSIVESILLTEKDF